MNKIKKIILTAILLVFCAALWAFENPVYWSADYFSLNEKGSAVYQFTGNPATYIPGEESKESLDLYYSSTVNGYQREYDPASVNAFGAVFNAFRCVDDKSFFSFKIDYDQSRFVQHFASMEKYFYDDYFSMIDSTTGSADYYGPTLEFMYQKQILKNLYLGLDVDYGVERSLKDTFPETITIMRNSDYRLGLDYRLPGLSVNASVRYHDNKINYEAVKKYTSVIPHTYMGYNVFYNEASASTVKKIRNRKGVELACGFDLDLGKFSKFKFAYAKFQRETETAYKRGTRSYERGYWYRDGFQLSSTLDILSDGPFAVSFFGEFNDFSDWGSFRLVNTLVLDNRETRKKAGFVFSYKPSRVMSSRLGGEFGNYVYEYEEYIFPFHEERSLNEWRVFIGESFFLGSKTEMDLSMNVGKAAVKFYWNSDYMNYVSVLANIEHFFPFGYMGLNCSYSRNEFQGQDPVNSYLAIGISYKRK